MSQTTTSKRPLTVLQKNTKKDVIVTLKSGVETKKQKVRGSRKCLWWLAGMRDCCA